jgi:cadmium resistance protein CadD (predicted permease)
LLAVSAVTIANGADNIAVYTPLFRAMSLADVATTIIVFLLLIAVWCAAGRMLGSHRGATTVIERWGHWLVPAVFIAIGLVIVVESNVLSHVADVL